jgi:hypothetical protein
MREREMLKRTVDRKPFVWQDDRTAKSGDGRKARKQEGREVG